MSNGSRKKAAKRVKLEAVDGENDLHSPPQVLTATVKLEDASSSEGKPAVDTCKAEQECISVKPEKLEFSAATHQHRPGEVCPARRA